MTQLVRSQRLMYAMKQTTLQNHVTRKESVFLLLCLTIKLFQWFNAELLQLKLFYIFDAWQFQV